MDLYAFFQSEVKPTIGCTEPGAVAYAAAVAARHLPTQPEGIRLEMSVAIYKNGRSVGIPGTNGLRGLTLACVLGALGGNPDKGLMALEDIPAATVEQAQRQKKIGADVIALSCTGMSSIQIAPALERETGLPVLDPVMCEGLMTLFELIRKDAQAK